MNMRLVTPLALVCLALCAGPAAAWTYCCTNGSIATFDCDGQGESGASVHLDTYGLTSDAVTAACAPRMDPGDGGPQPQSPDSELFEGGITIDNLSGIAYSPYHQERFLSIASTFESVTGRLEAGSYDTAMVADRVDGIVTGMLALRADGAFEGADEAADRFIFLATRIVRHLAAQELFNAELFAEADPRALLPGEGMIAEGDARNAAGYAEEALFGYHGALGSALGLQR